MKLFEIHVNVEALGELISLMRAPVKRDPEILMANIEQLEFGKRTFEGLRYQVETVGDLIRKTPRDILNIPNLGRTALKEIKATLDIHGLWLGMKIL